MIQERKTETDGSVREMTAKFPRLMENIRKKDPLVQTITNFVTVNDCANMILAAGGSPTMAHHVLEVEEAVTKAQALVLNLGAVDDMEAMLAAGKAANRAGVPVVFDPVGVGSTAFRRGWGKKLMENVNFAVIRGNASEIRHLAQGRSSARGVDVSGEDCITEENYKRFGAMARELAEKTGAVVAISGVIDIVASPERVFVLRNGDEMMSRISGSGCMLTAFSGGFLF